MAREALVMWRPLLDTASPRRYDGALKLTRTGGDPFFTWGNDPIAGGRGLRY